MAARIPVKSYCRLFFPKTKHVSLNLGLVIEMKGITRCKLTIISESAVHKKFLGKIITYLASL